MREYFRLHPMQVGSEHRATLPDLFRADQPEGRVFRQSLGVVHVFVARKVLGDRFVAAG